MKNKMKEAHSMAKEFKSKYQGVDYKAQFGLCLSYLLNKEEENMKKFEFITRQGLNGSIEVLELENNDYPVISSIEIDYKIIFKDGSGKYKEPKFDTRRDNKTNEMCFCMELQGEALENFKKASKITSKVKTALVEVNNIDLEQLYKEMPARRKLQRRMKSDEEFRNFKGEVICWKSGNTFHINKKEFEHSEIAKQLENRLGQYDVQEALKEYETEVDWGDYSITHYYKMTLEQLKEVEKVALGIKINIEQKRIEKEQKEIARVEDLLKKARETGEKQVIKSYSCSCNDPNEECDVDIVTVYAMPDGSEKKIRSHTW